MYEELNNEIRRFLLLRSHPIAVRMIREGEEIPEEATRPLKDLGHHLSMCQAFATSRYHGETFAVLKEDNWCFEPVIGFGMAKPPEYFLDGHNRFPGTARDLEAGSRWANNMPRLETGLYRGVLCAPLGKAHFDPDVVMIYCNPGQLTQLLIAANWIDGRDVNSVLSGHAGCVYATVPAIKSEDFHVCIPCLGDRARAMAQDDELVFTVPGHKIGDLMAGLKAGAEDGEFCFPVKYSLKPEYELAESYKTIGRMVGIDIEREDGEPDGK